MFDDLNPQENKQSIPAPAEDIFSDADPVREKRSLKPAPFQPKPASVQNQFQTDIPQPVMAPIAYDEPGGNGKKLFILGLTILVMAGVAYGLFYAFSRFGNPFAEKQETNIAEQRESEEQPVQPESSSSENAQANVIAPTLDDTVPAAGQTQDPIIPQTPAVKDSDQDGLTDDEEINTYNTNPNLTDTDEDGLFDREEIMVYHTDPLVKDTDGDSYSDGAEVKGGYNPNGAGKLYDITKP